MKILLDTHAFLWFIAGNTQLDAHARQLIEDLDNERYLSVASVWEMTIKSSLGRLTAPMPPSVLIRDHVWSNAISLLHISLEHLDILHDLLHDPFDYASHSRGNGSYHKRSGIQPVQCSSSMVINLRCDDQ